MKTLHVYVTRQVLATVLMTVAIFASVLLLGNLIREVFLLLLNDQVSLATIAKAIALLIPYVLVFALPMGLLTAMLLTFGRLSADHELVAIRGGGISILSLITPVLLLAVALSAVSAGINLYVAPKCRMLYKDLLDDLKQIRPTAVLTPGRFVKDVPPYIIYVGKVKDDVMYDVLISKLEDGEVTVNLRASRAVLLRQESTNSFLLRLYDTSGAALEKGVWKPLPFAGEWEYPVVLPPRRSRLIKLNEMTFFELREELRLLEQTLGVAPRTNAPATPEGRLVAQQRREPLHRLASPLQVEMHHQLAFSFACIGFTLVGIPLGIRSHRKETSIGVAISLVLILVYYSFFILAGALATKSQYYPWLFCWIPNFLFEVLGAYLLWRVNRS